ncbi:AGE family epimerase/isomerase [Aquabacter sp. CN5-332]|uniref:AGE family epimerase/isomerase n=1 Tax=Aquabacter sp. CN5-332 TaxID=3156608 RepID=UPI0032B4CB5E
MSVEDEFEAARAELLRWLFEDALPLWSTVGVDFEAGGFFEKLSPEGVPIDEPRRARVVARQIYSFATAERLGWKGPARDIVRHGINALFKHHLGPTGLVIPSVDRAGRVVRSEFDLYDHAFVLFGLAAAAKIGERPDEMAARARLLLQDMRAGFAHPLGGFEEARPRTLPLKANPHMHLLEAALAWEELEPDGVWSALADEMVDLCLTHFINPETGAVHEYFDGDWQRLTDYEGSVVEPGHQFEWAWLLMRWGLGRSDRGALVTANRLTSLAEARGVQHGMALNVLSSDLTVRDSRKRLWSQTERMKAISLRVQSSESLEVKLRGIKYGALSALALFIEHPVRGCWWEYVDIDCVPVVEPARTSSLYHIVGAILCAEEAQEEIVGRRRRLS